MSDIDVHADPEQVVWSLKKLVAMQRTMPLPDGVGGIGGWAELTTISQDGISQRILERWPEDRVGGYLRHQPVKWDTWHRDNPRPGAARKLRAVQ